MYCAYAKQYKKKYTTLAWILGRWDRVIKMTAESKETDN